MDSSIREQLEVPFDKKFIKQRKGNFGKMLDYVEADRVIQRLNNIFGSEWSVEIITKPQEAFIDKHIIVGVRLTVPNIEKDENGVLVRKGDIVKEAFGGKKANLAKVDGSFLDLASDYKASFQDGLKKASTYLGIALDLYGTDEKESDTKDNVVEDKGHAQIEEKDEPVTKTQLSAITSLAKTKKITNLNEFVSKLVKKEVKDINALTKSQASLVIAELNAAKSV